MLKTSYLVSISLVAVRKVTAPLTRVTDLHGISGIESIFRLFTQLYTCIGTKITLADDMALTRGINSKVKVN